MAVNIYDTANQLESELRKTEQYLQLEKAYAEMKKDQVAYDLFKDFQTSQIELQQKQYQGQELTDEEIAKAQELAGKIGEFDTIKNLMEKERTMSQLMDELTQIMSKPIQELYRN